jgi:hypothetical protein
MKRGLVEWDPAELPREALAARVARYQALLAERGLDAAVFYTSVAQPVAVRYLTHFLPYWNEGVLVLPRAGEPALFVALSNRVVPWIKGSSTLRDVRAARSLAGDTARYLQERGAARIGLVDRGSFPYRLVEELRAQLPAGAWVDLPPLGATLPLGQDPDERRLRRRAGALAAQALAEVGATVAGLTDHQLAGRLDRALRLAGAEDTLVLVGPAGRWPGLPCGVLLGEQVHVVLQVEYKGHWVQLGRTLGGPPDGHLAERIRAWCAPGRRVGAIAATAQVQEGTAIYLYRSERGTPFTALGAEAQLATGDIVAVLALHPASRALYGDTFAVEADGLLALS